MTETDKAPADQQTGSQDPSLRQQLAAREAELTILNSIQAALAAKQDLDAIFELVGEQISELFPGHSVALYTVGEDGNLAHARYMIEDGERHYPPPIEPGPIARHLLDTRRSIMISTRAQFEEIGTVTIEGTQPSASGMYAPMVVGGEILGSVAVESPEQENAFTEADLSFLTTLANSLSLALENARLLEEVQRSNQELTEALQQQSAVSGILRVMATMPAELGPVLKAVAEQARQLCQADDVQVYQVDGDQLRQVAHSGPLPGLEEGETLPLVPGLITGRAVLEQRTIHTHDAQEISPDEYPVSAELQRRLQHRSVIVTPMIKDEQSVGAIVARRNEVRPFRDKQLDLLATLADQAVIAIENVRLFHETKRLLQESEQRAAELQIINSVQTSLASKLDLQEIYDAVGEKLHEIFPESQVVDILDYDSQSDLFQPRFVLERGKRYQVEPWESRGFRKHVVDTGQPLIINHDMAAMAEKYDNDWVVLGERAKSFVAVPMKIAGQVIGVISLQHLDREGAFSASDVSLLETLASSMSVALENARLFDETQRLLEESEQRAAELQIINSVQQGLASKLDIQEIYDLVGDSLREIFQSDTAFIAFLNETRDRLHFPYYNDRGSSAEHMSRAYAEDGVFGELARRRRPLMFNSPEEYYALLEGADVPATPSPGSDQDLNQSNIQAPIFRDGEVVGCVSVQSYDLNAFNHNDLNLLETLANSMSAALENARLFDETQRLLRETEQRAAELSIINTVQNALASRLDIDGIYEAVGEQLRRIFNSQVVAISTADMEKKVLRSRYVYEKGARMENQILPFNSLYEDLLRTVAADGTLVLNGNFPEYAAQFDDYQVPQGEMPVSVVAVPIPPSQHSNTIDLLTLQDVDGVVRFSESDVRLLETLAGSMGVALENARLFDETERLLKETEERAAELQIINSVQRGLASQLDLDEIYSLIGDKLREIFEADTTFIAFHDVENEAIASPYYSDRGKRLGRGSRPYGQGLAEVVIEAGKPVLFHTSQEWHAVGALDMPSPGSDRDLNESILGVPIYQENKAIGVASVQSYKPHAFDENDLTLLQTLINSMSVAMENARLFDETQRLLKETEQRAAELQIINSVQQGLASKLEIQAIYELLGDKIREIFNADSTFIAFHDKEKNLIRVPYYNDRGERQMGWERPYGSGGAYETMVEKGGPLHWNSLDEMEEAEVYSVPSPGSDEDLNQSLLLVPIIIDGEIVGATSVQSYEKNAFSQNDLTLLETLTNSMSVALENARLFDETERLLQETEQRASELATINAVGQALVGEPELDALIDLIGDQIRQTFSADIAYVALLDQDSQTIHFPYTHGEVFDPLPLGEGLTSKIIESGEPLLINRDIDQRRDELGVTQVGKRASSYLGVPIRMAGEVLGVLSAQSTREEGRFEENDLDLLNTIAVNVGVALRNAQLFDQIKRQKQYYQAVIENSPAAIVLLDMQANVTGWNPAAERLFGYSREEALGHNVDDLVANHPDLHQEAVAYSQQAMRHREVSQLARRTRKDGSFVEVDMAGVPVSVDGEFVGFIAIYHDVTELQQARKEAEQANQAKSTFLANMSHELRTPLNAIIGFTRIVRRKGEESLPDKQVENLDKVLVSADHLLNLINTVLDISKIEAGRMEVKATDFELPGLIQQIADTAQPLIGENVDFQVNVPADLPTLHTDQEKLKQILINLLSNAAKFTSRGEIELAVEHDGNFVRIDVRDTGIGISRDDLEYIFEEFQQADSSSTREYGGTGLGLSISRSLARLLGGELSAVSEVDKGSTFSLILPERYGPARTLAEPGQLPSAAVQEAGDALIVVAIDDDPNVHDLLRENLGDAGYHVVSAMTGMHGLQLARELRPFAITLDIMMPNKDGWQVLHDLKADPSTRDIPVIMLTIVDKQSLGYKLGAADYLVKPLDEDAVVSALRRLRQHGLVEGPSRILVVDDDPNIAEMVRQLLEGEPYQVEAAPNGQAALESVRNQPPQAMLLDLMMPVMDGFALLEALREERAEFPIIVLTAKSLSQSELENLEGKVERVIEKNGMDQARLLAELKQTMGNLDDGRLAPGSRRESG